MTHYTVVYVLWVPYFDGLLFFSMSAPISVVATWSLNTGFFLLELNFNSVFDGRQCTRLTTFSRFKTRLQDQFFSLDNVVVHRCQKNVHLLLVKLPVLNANCSTSVSFLLNSNVCFVVSLW